MYTEKEYQLLQDKAAELKFDGCTGVIDFYVDCCNHHDFMYRTGNNIRGIPVSRKEADAEFRRCMQSRSRLGICNPMSWWRWIGVRLFGRRKNAKS
jgi:hypothetical protein